MNNNENDPSRNNSTPSKSLVTRASSAGVLMKSDAIKRYPSFSGHSLSQSMKKKNTDKRQQLQKQEIELMKKHRLEQIELQIAHEERSQEIEEAYRRQVKDFTKERTRQTKRLLEEQKAEMRVFQMRKAHQEYSRICSELALALSERRLQQGNGRQEQDHYVTLWQSEDPVLFHWGRTVHNQSNKNGLNACLAGYGIVCVESKATEFYPFVRFRLTKS